MGTKIKDAQLLESVTGAERIPVSDGSGNPKAVTTEALKNFVGASGDGGGMIEITYAELKSLRDNGKLIPGQMYRMTDYETTTSQEGTQAAGRPFDLILTALDEKTLDEKCSAIQSTRDTDGYFANSNLAAWELKYSLDNKFWSLTNGIKINLYNTEISFSYMGVYNYNNTEYYQYSFESGSVLVEKAELKVGGVTSYIIVEGQIQEFEIEIISYSDKEGTGVIYSMIDEFGNSAWWDLKNILFNKRTDYWREAISSNVVINNNITDLSLYGWVIVTFQYVTKNILKLPIMHGEFQEKTKSGIKKPYNVVIIYDDDTINEELRFTTQDYTIIERCYFTASSISGHFKNVRGLKARQLEVKKVFNIKDAEYNNMLSGGDAIITQLSDSSIIFYTDEDIYNAIQATKS